MSHGDLASKCNAAEMEGKTVVGCRPQKSVVQQVGHQTSFDAAALCAENEEIGGSDCKEAFCADRYYPKSGYDRILQESKTEIFDFITQMAN